MLSTPSIADAKQLLSYFVAAGYDETGLRKSLGSVELPSRSLRNEPRLFHRTSEETTLNTLLRLFWLGRAVEIGIVSRLVPEDFLHLLFESKLLRQDGEMVRADVMLLPVDEFLVVADHPFAFERAEADLVLWPNPTSRFLGRFTIRNHAGATLDLGAGSGILSLWAGKHSDKVVATDLNPRATSFVEFNARLNGFDNIEALTGESFAAVEGRRFDLIVCNPPFFISPRSEYLFCDNPLDLDNLVRDLLGKAGSYLNEGGYLQMLCEWAQLSGQPWEERVAGWLEGTGCDAWIMKGLTQAPEEYAQQRIRETVSDATRDEEIYEGYMTYYRERRVEAIHDGLIVMRRRTGDNWIRIEEVPKTPTGALGDLVTATFAAHDFLREIESDEQLLALRPKLAPHVRLEQICEPSHGQWKAESLTLKLMSGFPFFMATLPLVADFLVNCDGEKTVEQVITGFAAAVEAPFDTVQRECLGIIRKLIERGFVVAAT